MGEEQRWNPGAPRAEGSARAAATAQGAQGSEERAEDFKTPTGQTFVTCIAAGHRNPSGGSGPGLGTELVLGTKLRSC